MSATTVLDGICRYFGGNYDEQTRTYRSSPIALVGIVRRASPKRDDHADYVYGQPPGARTGCQIVVTLFHSDEFRIALGGEHGGWKQTNFNVELACFLRSATEYAEDAQDDAYALRDDLVAWIRRDRTLGDCVFQAGEAMKNGSNVISTDYGQPVTKAELTKGFLSIRFSACELVPNA